MSQVMEIGSEYSAEATYANLTLDFEMVAHEGEVFGDAAAVFQWACRCR